MNKNAEPLPEDDMLPEYDFSGGVREKYAAALSKGYRVVIQLADGTMVEEDWRLPEGAVILEPDLRAYSAEVVNSALRKVIAAIQPHLAPQQPE